MAIEGCMKDDAGDLASPEFIPAERRDQPDNNQSDDVEQGAPLRYYNTISLVQKTDKEQENDRDKENEKAESSCDEILVVEGNSDENLYDETPGDSTVYSGNESGSSVRSSLSRRADGRKGDNLASAPSEGAIRHMKRRALVT
jgi:hypothetical protein